MFRMVPGLALYMMLCAMSASAADDPRREEGEAGARAAMAAFLKAFNARDEEAWADSLVYPHVRLASGTVKVYADREAFVAEADMDKFAEDNNWGYSTWDAIKLAQADENKVHFTVTFSRYRPNGQVYATFHSLYVVERVDGRWGIRARSSFAP